MFGQSEELLVELAGGKNAMPSAVPWTSMKRPEPVMTTFMSTSAVESSE